MLHSKNRLIIAACIVFAFLLGVFTGKYFSEEAEINIPNHHFYQMSLLTWQGHAGDICFLLVPRIEQGRAIHDFWSKWQGQCGVSQLKEKLASVPKEKSVVWTDRPPRFEFPSETFRDELVEFAKSKGLDLSLSPRLDGEVYPEWEPRRQ